MSVTVEIPDEIAARVRASGVSEKDLPHFALAAVREKLERSAIPLVIEDRTPATQEDDESIEAAFQAIAEGKVRLSTDANRAFRQRHRLPNE